MTVLKALSGKVVVYGHVFEPVGFTGGYKGFSIKCTKKRDLFAEFRTHGYEPIRCQLNGSPEAEALTERSLESSFEVFEKLFLDLKRVFQESCNSAEKLRHVFLLEVI